VVAARELGTIASPEPLVWTTPSSSVEFSETTPHRQRPRQQRPGRFSSSLLRIALPRDRSPWSSWCAGGSRFGWLGTIRRLWWRWPKRSRGPRGDPDHSPDANLGGGGAGGFSPRDRWAGAPVSPSVKDSGEHVYVYRSMRRGGRNLDALDITDRTSPVNLTVEDRNTRLKRGGIPPEPIALFREEGSGDIVPELLVGPELIRTNATLNVYRTFWLQEH
jgi:hypothetical protein